MRMLGLLIISATLSGAAHAEDIAWSKVDQAMGRAAAVSQDVHRYGFPRTDLSVTLDGVTIKPALALGGWVAFKPMGNQAMVMGDLVLLESEVNPVMLKMIEGGLDITASTITCCVPARPPSTCMSVAMATRPRWLR
jgi:hypothetical protein